MYFVPIWWFFENLEATCLLKNAKFILLKMIWEYFCTNFVIKSFVHNFLLFLGLFESDVIHSRLYQLLVFSFLRCLYLRKKLYSWIQRSNLLNKCSSCTKIQVLILFYYIVYKRLFCIVWNIIIDFKITFALSLF